MNIISHSRDFTTLLYSSCNHNQLCKLSMIWEIRVTRKVKRNFEYLFIYLHTRVNDAYEFKLDLRIGHTNNFNKKKFTWRTLMTLDLFTVFFFTSFQIIFGIKIDFFFILCGMWGLYKFWLNTKKNKILCVLLVVFRA